MFKDTKLSKRTMILRGAGLALILTGALTFDEAATVPMHTLWLPLMMAVGAALALQNLLAVALAITALAGIHADPGGSDWVAARAYPALAGAGAVVITVILARRFRHTMANTRAARVAARAARRNP